MYGLPNVKDLITSVEHVLQSAVLPHVSDLQARQKAEMSLAVLHWAGRLVPVEQQLLAREACEMQSLFAQLATLFASDESPEAHRFRERGRRAQADALPALPPYHELLGLHRVLSESIIAALDDLHALDERGCQQAREGLRHVRAHLSRQARRDLEVYLGTAPSGAMVGRS